MYSTRTNEFILNIVFAILTIGLLGLGLPSFASGSEPSKEYPVAVHQTDVRKIQRILYDKGHYRGKIDGVFGLHTRASLRAFQKAEKLPVTGQLDKQTASKLGVSAEIIGGGSKGLGQETGRKDTGHETTKGKPSAGTKRSKNSGQSNEPRPKPGTLP